MRCARLAHSRTTLASSVGANVEERQMQYFRCVAGAWLLVLAAATLVAAGQSGGTIDGVVVDSSGARLPGVTVEVVATPRGVKPIAVTVTDAQGAFRVSPVRAGEYMVRFSLIGFSRPEAPAIVAAGATVTIPVTLESSG
jgi:hypothetical protein